MSTPPWQLPRAAFETFSLTTREERLALLDRIIEVYKSHVPEMGEIISQEMGAPVWMAKAAQATFGYRPLRNRSEGAGRLRVREGDGHDAGRARTDRRLRPDHTVELADQPDRLQGRTCARRRLHDGAEALRSRAAERDPLRRDPR